ncbi:hypothetical protein ES707_16601 [subsurface metagenome]
MWEGRTINVMKTENPLPLSRGGGSRMVKRLIADLIYPSPILFVKSFRGLDFNPGAS